MDHATTDALMRELEALLPPCVHEQLVRGGETGICEQTLRRWLVARKVRYGRSQLAQERRMYVGFGPPSHLPFLQATSHPAWLAAHHDAH
jgi:hypothetical protein